MKLNARLTRGDFSRPAENLFREAKHRMEAAALIATHRGAKIATSSIRNAMASAGLGRLGNAVGSSSDLERGQGVHHAANGGFSASGVIFIRSKSERTRGAIESYTAGSTIEPVRSRWLWIPSDEVQRLAGTRGKRERVTPGNWSRLGLDNRIGPLVFVRTKGGRPLLVVRNVGVSAAGKARSARALTKRGTARKGQVAQDVVIAFVGIPGTARAARVNVPTIIRSVSDQLPGLFAQALRKA